MAKGGEMNTEDALQQQLAAVARDAPPKLASFALWLIDHLPKVAFSSIRGVAAQAGTNPNTVTRLAQRLGFSGFDAFRAEVRQALAPSTAPYGQRAQALRNRPGTEIWDEALQTNLENLTSFFQPAGLARLEHCINPLLSARRVHAVGVRSCLSVAHYLAYAGAMAFDNFAEFPAMPGAIMDQMSTTTPNDIVVAITYAHYSAEVVRACQVARLRGARVLAITDSHASPIAEDAWQVLKIPMNGPQLMPSLSTAFVAVELLLAAMAARSDRAAENIAKHEARIRDYGGYIALK